MSKIIKQAIKHTGRPRKELIVAELVKKIDASNSLVFTDYKGLTHVQLEILKKELKKLDATIVIAKNSLLKISLGKSKNYADFKDNEKLNLPTATLFIQGDYVEPLKKVQKSVKDFGRPVIKFGILEGHLLDESSMLKIASLPNRETLLTQLVGTLNSPIQGLVVTLNGTIQKFVMTLNAIASAKQNSELVQAEAALQAEQAEEVAKAPATEEPAETTPTSDESTAEKPEETPAEEAASETQNADQTDKSKGGEN